MGFVKLIEITSWDLNFGGDWNLEECCESDTSREWLPLSLKLNLVGLENHVSFNFKTSLPIKF